MAPFSRHADWAVRCQSLAVGRAVRPRSENLVSLRPACYVVAQPHIEGDGLLWPGHHPEQMAEQHLRGLQKGQYAMDYYLMVCPSSGTQNLIAGALVDFHHDPGSTGTLRGGPFPLCPTRATQEHAP